MEEKELLQRFIEEKVFKTKKDFVIVHEQQEIDWIMDFKGVAFDIDFLPRVSSALLMEIYKEVKNPFQIGGQEVGAIPFIAGMVLSSSLDSSREKVHGFFMRKSRKKSGLLNIIEGEVFNKDIVLIDDILNNGFTFARQIEILEKENKKVVAVATILRFRDKKEYLFLQEKNIKIISLFDLNDFKDSLGLQNLYKEENNKSIKKSNFDIKWYFKSNNPSLEFVLPKSALVCENALLFFGADNGFFRALSTENGKPLWEYKINHGFGRKKIFSTACIANTMVIFGAYDGNLYALDKKTGKKVWITYDADWIGSSPCFIEDKGLVVVGMEFGLLKKKGGVAAYDALTGKKVWLFESLSYTHASPGYTKKYGLLICGSNDGVLTALDAKSGTVSWNKSLGGEIKAGVAFSPSQKMVACGTFSHSFVVLETKTGKIIHTFETLSANYSAPLWISEDIFIATSLDKNIYAFSLKEKKILWFFETGSRIFSTPYFYKGCIYFGNNAGILFVLDSLSGKEIARHYFSERITNKVVIDEKGTLYVSTYANEVFALEDKSEF